jgi:hypothetical protein
VPNSYATPADNYATRRSVSRRDVNRGLATYYHFLFQGAPLILGVGVGTFARRRAQA